MRRLAINLLVLTIAAGPALSQTGNVEACAAVYQNAVKDISFETTDTTEKSYYFNLYCKKSGDLSELSTSASVSFPIKGIPIALSGNGDWSRSEVEEFCQIGSESISTTPHPSPSHQSWCPTL